MKRAIYAFSGDPVTYGHIDIIKRAARIFDEVTAAIGVNPDKKYLFSLADRLNMAKRALRNLKNVKVIPLTGLLVDYAYEHNIPVIIKGLRNSDDFNYEANLHYMSESQGLDIDTMFLPSQQKYSHISSSAAKILQKEQGFIRDLVPLFIKQFLEAKISGQYIIGVTGVIGSGKSYLCDKLVETGMDKMIQVYNIELDKIGHEILQDLDEPVYGRIRDKLTHRFGKKIRNKDGSINRLKLGEIVFADKNALGDLNHILAKPMQVRLRRLLYGKKGIILFNAALIAESGLEYVSNNNVVLINTDNQTQENRLQARNISGEELETRKKNQFSFDEKYARVTEKIKEKHHGKVWLFNNSQTVTENDFELLFKDIVNYIDIYGELRFKALYKRLDIERFFESDYRNLVEAFNQPHRCHHTLYHTLICIAELYKIKEFLNDRNAVEASLWYSRFIYEPKDSRSIENSAVYAYNTLMRTGLRDGFCTKIANFIRCTTHTSIELKDDAAYVVDLDNLILGKPLEEFKEYEYNIRKEFNWMDDNKYKRFRYEYFLNLFERQRIYLTDYYYNKYEETARNNIEYFFNTWELR